jgi:predicted GNAT family acetyltransferase
VEEVEETEEAEESEEAEETEEVIEDEEEINPLDGVDPNKLSATERMFYDYVVAEKEKAKKREVSLIIQGSQLDIKHKMILDRMAKDGVSRKLIESTIEDLKQIQASSVRVGGTKIVSKSKLKTKTTPAKDDKIPKMGTREYGVYLANLRKTKKI